MAVVYPHSFQDNVGETASGVQVMDNFNVLKVLLEGKLTGENMAASIKDGAAGTASLRTLGTGAAQALSTANLKATELAPTIGPTGLFGYVDSTVDYPTACQFAWLSGWLCYSDAGHTAGVANNAFNCTVAPSGKNLSVGVQNGSGITLYPRILVVTIGH